jgi:hypothetical protein
MERARNITAHIQKTLKIVRKMIQNVREAMIKSADKKRKEMVYNPRNLVF